MLCFQITFKCNVVTHFEQRIVLLWLKTLSLQNLHLLLGVIRARKLMHAFFRVPPRPPSAAGCLFQRFIPLTLTTSSSVEAHLTASETSITEASMPTVTTFTGTATVFPVRTAVFKISESCRQKKQSSAYRSSNSGQTEMTSFER